MKKKFITERKWNYMFDHLGDDLCDKVNEDGSRVFTPENFNTLMDRVKNLPDYRIVGLKHQIGYAIDKVKEKHRNYKLNHLKMGKFVSSKKDTDVESFHVEGISWDAHWQMDRILAIIIRDYLRYFIKETPVIGNCVLLDNPEGLDYFEASQSDTIDFAKRWEDTVNKVADEFDDLRRLIENYYSDDAATDEEIQKAIEKAFKDLIYIYPDLSW